jgi:hypothetical protein
MMVAAAGTLGATLQPPAAMLQAVAPTLQVLALPLPDPATVFVTSALHPLTATLPTPPPPLHPVPVPLQLLAATLQPPALTTVLTLVARMPAACLRRGTLDREGIRGSGLGGRRRGRAPQRGGEGERRMATCHQGLPAAGPRGWMENMTDSNGRETTKRSER